MERFKTRDQLRRERSQQILVSAHLELQLRDLIRRVLSEGDFDALAEFQQTIQYAPPEMKARILELIGGKVSCKIAKLKPS